MSLDRQLAECFNQKINISKLEGISSDGDPQYSDTEAHNAFVVAKRKVVTNASGEEVMSDHTIFTEAVVDLHDRIWLPGQDVTLQECSRLPKFIRTGIDEDGSTTHHEVAV